jgi:orotidine-5'-phosphate decarboxylase
MHDPRLIVALDYPTITQASELVGELGDTVSFYKVGLTLLSKPRGVLFAETLREMGKKVFQDWKFHDIGAQVTGAVRSVCETGCDFLTVHAEPQVMHAAVAGRSRGTCILAVTVLTSLNDKDLLDIGYVEDTKTLVMHRVNQAMRAGVDGVVASPHEAAMIRSMVPPEFLIVTPGVRLPDGDHDDQKRFTTPSEALRAGASHLVVGRPITASLDPMAALRAILTHPYGMGDA